MVLLLVLRNRINIGDALIVARHRLENYEPLVPPERDVFEDLLNAVKPDEDNTKPATSKEYVRILYISTQCFDTFTVNMIPP